MLNMLCALHCAVSGGEVPRVQSNGTGSPERPATVSVNIKLVSSRPMPKPSCNRATAYAALQMQTTGSQLGVLHQQALRMKLRAPGMSFS